MSFGHQLARGEYVWTLHQFSWLPTVLQQRELGYLESSHFQVGKFTFEFVYNPHGGALTPSMTGQCGSLAIAPYESSEIALRWGIYIKKRGGDFVQWGKTCFEVHDGSETAYGPDVHEASKAPATVGIFGLTHEELLESQWVENDTLTVKFVLEVRPDEHFMSQLLRPTAEVPGPTLSRDMQPGGTLGTFQIPLVVLAVGAVGAAQNYNPGKPCLRTASAATCSSRCRMKR